MSATDVLETKSPTTAKEAEVLVREILARTRGEAEPAKGWTLRKERTSPLDTRHVTP
jgi:hypothetical protein